MVPTSAIAQTGRDRSQKPANWQLSDVCEIKVDIVNSNTKTDSEILSQKCYGIAVTQANNLNIHFASSHPSQGKPFVSFVLAEGPFKGGYPVEAAVLLLGQDKETVIETEIGRCRSFRNSNKSARAFVECSSVSATSPDGKYIRVIAVALFDSGLSPRIRSTLE